MEIKDLKTNTWYKASNGNFMYHKYNGNSYCFLGDNATNYYNKPYKWSDVVTYSTLTKEELHWCKICYKADKFISKEEALKTFNNKYYEVYN